MATRRYQIREKIFSLRDNFTIKDESNEPVYTVRSKLLSITDKLVLEDMAGNALLKIREKFFKLLPTFSILTASNCSDEEKELALVKTKFTLLRPKFDIESGYGKYLLDGLDILAHSYVLKKNDEIVATVSKKFFCLTDSYGVEINGEEDHAFILMLIICLDQAIFDK